MNKRISNTSAFLMLTTALFFDALQLVFTISAVLIPLSFVVSVWAWLTFFMWFTLHEVSYWSNRKLALQAGTFITELIPILSVLPAYTISTLAMLALVKFEDEAQFNLV